jgi:hypothetical protein
MIACLIYDATPSAENPMLLVQRRMHTMLLCNANG